jgi:hypothetical protein
LQLFSPDENSEELLGQGHTKQTENHNTTTTSEKHHRFQAGYWFPD